MKRKLLFLFLIILNFNYGFAQDFQWVRQIKGISSDYNDFAIGFAVDSNENCYLIGNTESILFDIDPTVSGTEIIDNSNLSHYFRGTYLIKTDVNGDYL